MVKFIDLDDLMALYELENVPSMILALFNFDKKNNKRRKKEDFVRTTNIINYKLLVTKDIYANHTCLTMPDGTHVWEMAIRTNLSNLGGTHKYTISLHNFDDSCFKKETNDVSEFKKIINELENKIFCENILIDVGFERD